MLPPCHDQYIGVSESGVGGHEFVPDACGTPSFDAVHEGESDVPMLMW